MSTLAFQSNLYPVIESCQTDNVFQSKIHAPFSLVILQKHLKMTRRELMGIQEQEYRSASVHCAYADKGDYPWGTIVDAEGFERVVCKCLNTGCGHFHSCRPDFDSAELAVHEENELAQPAIFKFDEKHQEKINNDDGDAGAAVKLFEGCNPKAEPAENIDTSEKLPESVATDSLVLPATPKTVPQPVKTAKVDFHSFVESAQEDIIEAMPSERGIVNAGPGTGKTWTLIEKITYMINNETAKAENILVLCFSRSAVEVIKSRLSVEAESGRIGYEWQDVDVRTFDSFSTYMLAWVQDNHPELLPQGFQLETYDYGARIRIATSILKKKHDMLGDYEHIIIDEVQDLVCNRAELVLALLHGLPETCGFTMLGDSCQSLYDYIATDDPGTISSEQFYQEIFKCFPNANYYALTENHRQGDELGLLSAPYRNAILTGTAQERAHVAVGLIADIPQVSGEIKKFNQTEAKRYAQQGTLGILTRTNGQALQISTWLRNKEVPHALQRGIGAPTLGDWISKLFSTYENSTIDEASFCTTHLALFPDISYDTAKARWAALTSTQYREAKSRYEISDLLRGLLRNAKEPALYQSNADKPYAITVSNIHRAKGKEFDSVIVIDDVIEAMAYPKIEDVLEHKVCYVALTRPKRQIERASIPTQYIYIAKNETRRCSKAGIRGKLRISHFEVGSDTDLDMYSLAYSEDIQKFMQHQMYPGMRLKLIKCPEGTNPYVTYRVVIEDNEHTVLGYTSKSFARELEMAIQRIKKISYSVYFQLYPRAFDDVYVDSITTCVSAIHPFPVGAKTFGDVSVWTGITITGFASVDTDTY